jgi:hypothetical protein
MTAASIEAAPVGSMPLGCRRPANREGVFEFPMKIEAYRWLHQLLGSNW